MNDRKPRYAIRDLSYKLIEGRRAVAVGQCVTNFYERF